MRYSPATFWAIVSAYVELAGGVLFAAGLLTPLVAALLCATCGHVGCCESQLAHGREHALTAEHPVILSLPLTTRSFTWCYEHKDYVQTPPELASSSRDRARGSA